YIRNNREDQIVAGYLAKFESIEGAKELLIFREEDSDRDSDEEESTESRAGSAVYTTFDITLDALDPLSRQLMKLFSYFGSDRIPAYLFETVQVEGSKKNLGQSLKQL